MKWQIGQATSLYLCVASGITGFAMGQIVAVSVVKVVESLTMKHTVNQGLRIVRLSCSGPGGGTYHLVMQCADQFPQL